MNLHKKCKHQHRVDLFMAMMRNDKQHTPPVPMEPSIDVRLLRAKLMLEECLETIQDGLGVKANLRKSVRNAIIENVEEAVFNDSQILPNGIKFDDLEFLIDKPFNMVETADGLADCDVVNIGTASACGFALEPIVEIVDCNNMAKFAPGYSFNEAGKLVKPPNHCPPTFAISEELTKQGWPSSKI